MCLCVCVFLPLNIFETIVNVLYSFWILRPQFWDRSSQSNLWNDRHHHHILWITLRINSLVALAKLLVVCNLIQLVETTCYLYFAIPNTKIRCSQPPCRLRFIKYRSCKGCRQTNERGIPPPLSKLVKSYYDVSSFWAWHHHKPPLALFIVHYGFVLS